MRVFHHFLGKGLHLILPMSHVERYFYPYFQVVYPALQVFCEHLNFAPVFTNFARIFRQIKTFGGSPAPRAPYTTAPARNFL